MTWHIGFVTPDGSYAAVEQSDGPAPAFLDDFVAGATRSAGVTISGAPWQRLEGGKPEPRALVLRGHGVTTMVTGSASFAELRHARECAARRLTVGRSPALAGWVSLGPQCRVVGQVLGRASSFAAAASRARAPSSHSWQIVASCSPRSHSTSDSSRVAPPVSSRRTTSASSSRACS